MKSRQVLREDEVKNLLFRSGRSVNQLMEATEEQLTPLLSENLLFCKICSPKCPEAEVGERYLGVFHYDFATGSRFSAEKALPTRFKTLRNSIRDYFKRNPACQERGACPASLEADTRPI